MGIFQNVISAIKWVLFSSGVSALRNRTGVNSDTRRRINYHTTSGDGGHGWFRWVSGAAAATYADNNGTIIVPTGGDGSAAWLREFTGPPDARFFGAVPGTAVDSYAAIAAAIAAHGVVQIDGGVYRVDTMLEVGASQGILVGRESGLIRVTASASTAPVVWLAATSAFCIGLSDTSLIETQKRCPDGVVLIGHRDMTQSHANVLYCTLKGFNISGSTAYGQTTGAMDIAVNLVNPQFTDLASYFHFVDSLRLDSVNVGVALQGYANANHIDNIQLIRVGNATGGRAGIWNRGADENMIGRVFHHSSPDSYTYVQDSYDNTGNGGINHTSLAYNNIGPIVSEQGGSSARCLVINTSGTRNAITRHRNVAMADIIPVGFYTASNSIQGEGYFAGASIVVGGVTLSGGTANGVVHLDGDKAQAATSALTFNGSTLGVASIASPSSLTLGYAANTDAFFQLNGVDIARFSDNVNGVLTVGKSGSVLSLGTDYGTIGAWGSAGGGYKIRRGTGAGTDVGLLYGNATGVFLGTTGAVPLVFSVNSVEGLRLDANNHWLPGTDNAQNAGSGALRLKEVFCANNVINVSDAREKTPVEALNAAEIAAAKELAGEVGTFKFLAAIAEKGEQARIHIGMTVQRAIEVMESHGLEPFKYSFICYDRWDAETREVVADDGEFDRQVTRQVTIETEFLRDEIEIIDGVPTLVVKARTTDVPQFEQVPVVDRDGQPVMVIDQPAKIAGTDNDGNITEPKEATYKQLTHPVPVMETVPERYNVITVREAGDRYSFRTAELTMFILRGLMA